MKSVGAYQNALIGYHEAKRNKSANLSAAEQNARTAGKQMQSHFRTELKWFDNLGSRRGTALTDIDRGIRIARDSRNITRLNLTSTLQASRLVSFSQYAKHLGNGLTLIDVGTRVGNIKLASDSGGDPYRELYIESSSFVASTGVAEAGATAGAVAIGFLVALTPVGWVGLVVVAGGAAVIAGTAWASIEANKFQKDNAGAQYDWIMSKLNR